MTCERVVMADGTVAIICGRGRSRIICDVCDAPVRRGSPTFNFRGRQVDLCASCQEKRAGGDPEWRRFAEKAMTRNLGLVTT